MTNEEKLIAAALAWAEVNEGSHVDHFGNELLKACETFRKKPPRVGEVWIAESGNFYGSESCPSDEQLSRVIELEPCRERLGPTAGVSREEVYKLMRRRLPEDGAKTDTELFMALIKKGEVKCE